jgi:hypothetical protein
MGTYKSIRILADFVTKEEAEGFFSILKKHHAEDCWRNFCSETKWWPDQLIKELVSAYPNVMFRLDYDGIRSEPMFYLGKEIIEGHFVLPYFPTRAKFKSGIKARNAYHKQVEKETQEKEKAAKKQQQEEIEAKERKMLEELKAKYE